jgi:predicted nucleic acid-binding protein
MNVLVDTCVWSLALRRKAEAPSAHAVELGELVREGRALIIGPIRQELLSGVGDPIHFARLRAHLSAFHDLQLKEADYELAAEFFNTCRRKGVQGSNTDFLICAVAVRCSLAILTTDGDFHLYSRHLPITLHRVKPTN